MNWEKLRRQLRREAYEYLADLRNFAIALRRAEGWFTLALVLAVIFMVAVWFVTGLGFDRLNQVVSALGQPRGRVCRPMEDFDALALIIDAMLMFLLAILALGEMMQLLNRTQRGQPKQPRKVMAPVAFMLIAGVAGIAYMRHIC
jgi:formate hydrogenlyase subunit 3/multisubunit Na+/H+ antiporter MnhD subunit